jgi:hypothetical protein
MATCTEEKDYYIIPKTYFQKLKFDKLESFMEVGFLDYVDLTDEQKKKYDNLKKMKDSDFVNI